MVIPKKEKYHAAVDREQVELLKALSHELEHERIVGDALAWRLREVELQWRWNCN